MDTHLLPREDAEAAAIVHQALCRDGVQVVVGAKIAAMETRGARKIVRYTDAAGQPGEAVVDTLLVAAGRVPNVEGLGLEEAGVRYDRRLGVQVDARLRTTNPYIFAAGDVCSRYQFTHAADALARLVLANALFMGRQKASALTIPWCTYTDPQIAHVGLTAAQAEAAGLAVTTFVQPLHDVDRAVLDGETEGFAKVHVKQGTGTIIGATIVARHAGEMIGLYTTLMTHKLGLGALTRVIQPYPTQAEAVRKTADAYNRTRLTPFVKNLMARWFAWQRGRLVKVARRPGVQGWYPGHSVIAVHSALCYAEQAPWDYGREGGSPCAVQAADAPIVQTPLFVMRVAPDWLGCANRPAWLSEYS